MLIVSVGTLALLVPMERAFLLAAIATLVLLTEQTLAQLQGITTGAQYAPAGILGAVIFVITAVVQLLRIGSSRPRPWRSSADSTCATSSS